MSDEQELKDLRAEVKTLKREVGAIKKTVDLNAKHGANVEHFTIKSFSIVYEMLLETINAVNVVGRAIAERFSDYIREIDLTRIEHFKAPPKIEGTYRTVEVVRKEFACELVEV